MATFTTRDEAIQAGIIDVIEASGEVAEADTAFNVAAIADEIITFDQATQLYSITVEHDEFWEIVFKHQRL
ncbi:hypothetical protein [Pseudomonas sp.]|uniref:hypothetical protein n=1 Tax=Pseudomonas sp. TaxID=306 RepID=UPI00261F43D4|nr:hypothetical protein [Pseudomonas sp.]